MIQDGALSNQFEKIRFLSGAFWLPPSIDDGGGVSHAGFVPGAVLAYAQVSGSFSSALIHRQF